MKKIALLLAFFMFTAALSGCTLEIVSISEAREVVDAYMHYQRTGNLPPDIDEMLGLGSVNGQDQPMQDLPAGSPDAALKKAIKATTKSEVLKLAEKYYNGAYPLIEADIRPEYNRLVTWEPDFSGKSPSSEAIELQKRNSVNVALALSYTKAKNFYLAMAASVFSLCPDDATAAGNLAAAAAAYCDDQAAFGGPAIVNAGNLYEDAEKIYHYALIQAQEKGKYNNDALPLLVSLGNLYLDMGKHEEAYACFQSALEINSEYFAATEGLYNTYMAMKQYKMAMDLIARTAKYPAMLGSTVKVCKKREEDQKKPGVSENASDEQALQKKLDSLNTIDSISSADFLDGIDEQAKQELNRLIRQVQDKMKYRAPDITLISQYATLKAISQPMGQSALIAFSEGIAQFTEEAMWLQEKVYNTVASEDAYEKIADAAQKYRRNRDLESMHQFFREYSALYPEFSIFSVNPYEYANPVDLIVQRRNIELFNSKYQAYVGYMGVVNGKVAKKLSEIMNLCNMKVDELWEEMNEKFASYKPPEGLEYDSKMEKWRRDLHAIDQNFYPRINDVRENAFTQATQLTVTAYQQKIKKYAEQMYNDCMKHVILISDETIQRKLEEKLRAGVMSGLAQSFEQIYLSYSFVTYEEDCGCDLASLEKARQQREEEQAQAEREQIMKNKEAKKRFETGEIDENSEYYKKIIKPYEVRISAPFIEGVVGPYKSGYKLKIDLPDAPYTLEFEQMEHHIRNTTTYNGGIEIGGSGEAGGAQIGTKAYLKFSAVKGADGNFSADDVDIIGGGSASLSTSFASATVGMEASAVRGTKSYADFSITADSGLNAEFKAAMGDWSPNLTKELWNGEYPVK